MRAAAFVLALIVTATTAAAGQSSLEGLIEKLSAYLDTYEPELATLVADETFDQTATVTSGPSAPRSKRQRLQSTVSFMRLPGGNAWLGIRSVRSVNGKPVAHEAALQALLAANTTDTRRHAVDIAEASARYNLGDTRTINMPTLPLELLHRRHRQQLSFRLGRPATIAGVRMARIEFSEKVPPSLIASGDGRPVISRGTVWIDGRTGAVWRAEAFNRLYIPGVTAFSIPEGAVKVTFARDAALGMLVPHEMTEVFGVAFGHGEGRARYSNYRRFTTSARIVPQR